jgi:TonB family protein
MPDPPMPAAESGNVPAEESSSADVSIAEPSSNEVAIRLGVDPRIESDLAALAARFAAHGGGSFSAEFAADLAFDIVLNEIAEQASLATGATGAAILLMHDGEMVCRACSGTTPTQLRTRLEKGPGIFQECMRTRRSQRSNDTQTDSRTDVQALRNGGVRSLLVLPLLRNQEVAGLLEVFSTRVAAFEANEERTLATMGERVLQNMENLTQPPASSEAAPTPLPSFSQVKSNPELRANNLRVAQGARKIISGRGFDVLTGALGFAVLICALMLGMMVRQRLASGLGSVHEHASKATSAGPGSNGEVRRSSNAANDSGALSSSTSTGNAQNQGSHDSSPHPGELRVYENGREVFHMPAAGGATESHRAADGLVQPASEVEAADTMELSPAAGQTGLLHRVEPDYPEEARRRGIQGAVVLEIHINPDGSVQDLDIISGPMLLAQAATDAVRQWKFKPHAVNGRPAEMQTVVTLNFRLPQPQ